MSNPVLAEVTRGNLVESVHEGVVAVVDADGRTVLELGDADRPVFPRSAVKALQALPLMESGAADRFGLTPAEIALACSSHSGEPLHAETAAAMLAKAGRDAGCLECGAHWPLGEAATRELARSGERPTALHNNCSGKHAGFVCLACGLGEDPAGYVGPDHRVQREVRAAMEEMTGENLSEAARGVDGCSIPTYATPLRGLALAFARVGTGHGVGRERAAALARIRAAAAAHPFMVAGTGRFDTEMMGLFGERVFCKTGAEGVYCAALPEVGLGIALKCLDGHGRAAQVMLAALVRRFLPLSEPESTRLEALSHPALVNWNGIRVGGVRPAGPLA
ncbi:asparaginase [Alsobacter sp. SYSU M60028]|uniref:Asparaginase n=1 Tax=Alsobacter ponti TaxID=2962936 RepID=A0ABT1L9R3_9HYPH|nr:asparaginase [Alsobacter ponti]MCP8937841.1 asparaginase [Alsobacter ponti]